MKYCDKFHDYLYLDNHEGGLCLCPWMEPSKACIGNVMADDIDEAYHSQHAEYLRSTMDDQSFRHCRPEACPHLQNGDLEEVTPEEYARRKKARYRPAQINMAYDFVCNQACETCRKAAFKPGAGYARQMRAIGEKIAPYLDTARLITASGHGDPFASPYMMEVLENLRPANPRLHISLETNGVLFDAAHWERISHLGAFHLEMVVTVNSFDPFTYAHISRGGNYEKLLRNLDFASKLRGEKKLAALTNAMVIQDRNFREIPAFIRRSFQDYAFDAVVLKPVYQWGTMDEDVFWFKDVLNPLHPYHAEYLEILREPALRDARVYHFGGDTLHPARPYPAGQAAGGPFLCAEVPKNSRVVIYGAGQAGREVMRRLKGNGDYTAVLWVDKAFDNGRVLSPNRLLNLPHSAYDAVILATQNPFFAQEMRRNLTDMGVPEERIISCAGGGGDENE